TYLRGHLPMRGMQHEDNSFSPDDARAGCRIGAAEANYGLRAGQRTQNVVTVHPGISAARAQLRASPVRSMAAWRFRLALVVASATRASPSTAPASRRW